MQLTMILLAALVLPTNRYTRIETDLVRFGAAYRNHLVAMDTKPLTDVFTRQEETHLWQTEFWGKYMHSAVPLLKRFPDAELERHVRDSACAVMDAQLPDGYIGNYREGLRAGEGWDVWGVKYTLMGLLHYHDLTHEERPLACARKLADWLMAEVGPGGRRRIVTTGNYVGMASCSVLEPIVWLFRVTGERRYLDFAAEIVREVGYDADGSQLVTKALAGVPVAERGPWRKTWWNDAKGNAMKAYEMMSCYQGMLDYAEAKVKLEGEDEASEVIRRAVLLTAEDIRTHEINLIGGAGSVEFWYGGTAKETLPHAHESETCVTITWMRLCEKLYRVTGDAKWIAEFRKSFFNVYLGALAPDGTRFASYPSLNGRRTYFRSHCGMATDCCNQNGMRGFVSALDLGVIAGETPEKVCATVDPHGAWTHLEKDGHVAFRCGELVMAAVGDDAALPVDLHGDDLGKLQSRLVPFACVGRDVYRTWLEVVRHPWDGRLGEKNKTCNEFDETRSLAVEEFRDRMRGAWLGQSAGVAFGWPTEFRYSGEIIPHEKMPVWKPELINETFNQDDLYVEMTFLDTLVRRGLGVSSRAAGIDFANSAYRLWCANDRARNNLRNGIAAPASSHPKYHASPDDIDYQIEADFSGILAPGLPQAAVDFGETFGRIMNYGDGLYAGQFVGALYAEAYFESNRVRVVERALTAIPAESKYAGMVRDVLGWYRADPYDWQATCRKIIAKYRTPAFRGKTSNVGIDVKLNGAMVVLGLLYGQGKMDDTMYVATAGGFDSDCNPSTACGVLGTMIGYRNIDAKFKSALDRSKKWEYTDYTWDSLIDTCERLTRDVVVRYGGRIETGADGEERFTVKIAAAKPSPFFDSSKPGPEPADAQLTEEERAQIRYSPCANQGEQSVAK